VRVTLLRRPKGKKLKPLKVCDHKKLITQKGQNKARQTQTMKTNQNKTLAVVMILAATLVLSSCQKENVAPVVKTKSTDVKWVDDTYNDLMKFAVNISSGSFKTEDAYAIAGCATITDDTISTPHTRTIDYGTGCMNNDGKTHKGRIILTYNTGDFLHTSGAYVQVALDNYFVDDNQITGSMALNNTGFNGNGNMTLTLDVDAKRVMANGSGTDSVVGNMAVEWVAGYSTSENSDDQFSYTGGASGSSSDGNTFQLTVLQPLIKNRAEGCYHYVKGETLVQISGESDRHVDYGDGTCDNLAVETVDGNSQTITLD
jgi:hypothetical protein